MFRLKQIFSYYKFILNTIKQFLVILTSHFVLNMVFSVKQTLYVNKNKAQALFTLWRIVVLYLSYNSTNDVQIFANH